MRHIRRWVYGLGILCACSASTRDPQKGESVGAKTAADVAATTLVGNWPLDDAQGQVIQDSTGNGHNGYLGDTSTPDARDPAWTTAGSALTFAANSDAHVPGGAAFELQSFSVEMWLRNPTPGPNGYALSYGVPLLGGNPAFGLSAGSDHISFSVTTSAGALSSPQKAAPVWDGAWHHVAATSDGTTLRLYVDGVEIGSGIALPSAIVYPTSQLNTLFIGSDLGAPSSATVGDYSRVSFYKGALDAATIANHAAQAAGGVPIKIDATALTEQHMQLPGYVGDFDTKKVQHLTLTPGTYMVYSDGGGYILANGQISTLTVKSDGTLDYDPSLNTVYNGRGTGALTLPGAPLTIDAHLLTQQGLQIPGLAGTFDSKTPLSLQVVPGSYMVYSNGGGYILGPSGQLQTLTVNNDGSITYDPSLKKTYSVSGSTVTLPGLPLTVDASPLTEQHMQMPGLVGDFDSKTPQVLSVVPGTYMVYSDGGGYVLGPQGQVNTLGVKSDGSFTYDASLNNVYKTSGTTVKLPGYPLTLDASPLTEQHMQMPGLVGDFDSKQPQVLIVVPGTYMVYSDGGGYVLGPQGEVNTLGVKSDGSFTYDASLNNVYKTSGSTVKLPGFPLTVDASPLTEQHMQMPGLVGDFDSKQPQALTVAPGTYMVYSDGGGYILGPGGGVNTLGVKNDGSIAYDASLNDVYKTSGSTVKLPGFPLTLDASPLTEQHMQMPGLVGDFDSKQPQALTVTTGTYMVYSDGGGYILGPQGGVNTLGVKIDGSITYDESLNSVYKTSGSTVKLPGFPLNFDASALPDQLVQLPGLTGNFDSKAAQSLQVAPGTYSVYTSLSGYVVGPNKSISTLEVGKTGQIAYANALDVAYAGRGTSSVSLSPYVPYVLNGGDAGTTSGTVGIFLGGWNRVCSGTQISSQWVLTSAACMPADLETPMPAVQFGDTSNPVFPSRIVLDPDGTVALLQVSTAEPLVSGDVSRSLYNGNIGALNQGTATAYGFGNGSTMDASPDPGELGLRLGSFTITSSTTDTTKFTLAPTGDVALVAGDEGGGTLYTDPRDSHTYLVGVHIKNPDGTFHDVASTVFHDFVMDTVFGQATYPNTFQRDPNTGFVVEGYTGPGDSWNPCNGGAFTWSAQYDFGNDGTASGSIVTGGVTTGLAGASTAQGAGSGAMTITETTGTTDVFGILTLSASCSVPAMTCPEGSTECVTNSSSATSAHVSTSQWEPCGATGCFAWGVTMNGAQTGDSIVVGGTSASSSTGAAKTASGACGAVNVDVYYGTTAGTRSDMDIWAVCGCKTKDQVCTAAAGQAPKCGVYTNECGSTFDCGGCSNGDTCSASTNGTCGCSGTMCNGQCVNTSTDVNNCGGCGNFCTWIDTVGVCNNGCCDSLVRCSNGSSCIDLVHDANNCGKCGNVCTHGICNGGNCLCEKNTCPAGACGTMSDGCGGTLNCGGCAAGDVCQGNKCGVCVPHCNGRCGADDGCGHACEGTCSLGACCSGPEGGYCNPKGYCGPLKPIQ